MVRRYAHVVFFAILLTLAVFFTTNVTEHDGGFESDGAIYGKMTSLPLFAYSDIPAPFCQRVLTPQLVSLLPGELLDRFRFVAFVASVLSLCVLYGILIHLGYSISMSYFGTLLYAGVFWSLKFSFFSPAYIDYVSQLILLSIIYASLTKRYVLAVTILCLSAFQKESLPIFSFFVAADLWHQKSQCGIARRASESAATIALPLASGYVVRILSQCSIDGLHMLRAMLGQLIRFFNPTFWPIFLHAMFSGLGLLPILLLVQYRPSLEFLRQRPAFLVYLFLAASALLGGSDKSRLFNYLLPVVVLLALATIRSFKPISIPRIAVWAVIVICGHWYLGNYLTPIGSFSDYLAKLVPEHAGRLGDGNNMPFLIRDCIFGVAIFVVTIQLMLGEWYFSPTIGFTRRNTERSAVSPE